MRGKIVVGLLLITLLTGCSGSKTTSLAQEKTAQPSDSAYVSVTTTATLSETKNTTIGATVILSDIGHITIDQLKPLFDQSASTGKWVYSSVDARDASAFLMGTIGFATIYGTDETSINIPPDSDRQSILDALKDLPKDKPIVFYDDFEDLAPVLAQTLLSFNLGYSLSNVKILKGGIDLWIEKGYPTVSAQV
jgi:rhodanese-related sulfurtransferase